MRTRTQIYLDPFQHEALLKEARGLGLSLAAMIRKLVDDYVIGEETSKTAIQEKKRAALALIGLGSSGLKDISERHDAYLGQALEKDVSLVRDAPSGPRRRKR